MATYAELQAPVLTKTQDYTIDITAYLKEAENEFIERTLCTEKFEPFDTDDQNNGNLSSTFDLNTVLSKPFYKESRVEWDGYPLIKMHRNNEQNWIHNLSDTERTGTPTHYWIEEDNSLRLIPKPTQHARVNVWYTYLLADQTAIDVTGQISGLSVASEFTQADTAEYAGGSLSASLATCTIDISGESYSNPIYNLISNNDIMIHLLSVSSTTITIGIGYGTDTDVEFTLQVLSNLTSGTTSFDESNTNEYAGGELSASLSECTISISGFSTPFYYILTPQSDTNLWIKSATSSLITIGIGYGTGSTVEFTLAIIESGLSVSQLSPVIPTADHKKLVEYAIYNILEVNEKDRLAASHKRRWDIYCNRAYRHYRGQRKVNNRLYDNSNIGSRNPASVQNRIPIIS